MEFTNVMFLCFLFPAFFLVHELIPTKFRNISILCLSFLILIWNHPVLFFSLVLLALFNYFVSLIFLKIHFFTLKSISFFVLIGLNLILFLLSLRFEKLWFVFFEEELIDSAIKSLFFMSNISYIIDIYRRRCSFQKNIIDYLIYIFMLPKIVLGPAVCYHRFERQLRKRTVNVQFTVEGLELFSIGLAKVAILAGEVSEVKKFIAFQALDSLSVLSAWMGACSVFLYLYFVLSGYSNMAAGIGKIMGFEFPVNFRSIFFSDSVENFFSCWHISVFSFFKIYIFPWVRTVKFSKIFKFFKIVLIAAMYAVFFGGEQTYFMASAYFLIVLFFENIFKNAFNLKISDKIKKLVTVFLILPGVAIFGQTSIFSSFEYVKAMFGSSGVIFDNSLIFINVFLRFFLIIFLLFISNLIFKNISVLKEGHQVKYRLARCFNSLLLIFFSFIFCIAS